jgi:hypothetical protein
MEESGIVEGRGYSPHCVERGESNFFRGLGSLKRGSRIGHIVRTEPLPVFHRADMKAPAKGPPERVGTFKSASTRNG